MHSHVEFTNCLAKATLNQIRKILINTLESKKELTEEMTEEEYEEYYFSVRHPSFIRDRADSERFSFNSCIEKVYQKQFNQSAKYLTTKRKRIKAKVDVNYLRA